MRGRTNRKRFGELGKKVEESLEERRVQRSKRGRQSLVDREASILKVERRNAFELVERSMLSNRKEKVLLHCYSRSVSAQLNDRERVMKTHL